MLFTFLKPKKTKKNPVVLLILDGYGVAPSSLGNAISQAGTPVMDALRAQYPSGKLIASGESVGLPANEDGNSEVGHLTIGAGRVINQSLVRIDKSIEDGNFYSNKAFTGAYEHVISNKSNMHIMGLISSGSVHSSASHLYALLEFCKRKKLSNVYLHLFTDGRDAPVKDGKKVIGELVDWIERNNTGIISTISGRYWAMDRDRRWDRTQSVYDLLVLGKGERAESVQEAIERSYNRNETDEFIKPTLIAQKGSEVVNINSNDAVIFFNFRIDRPRQLAMPFVLDNFENPKGFKFGYTPHDGGKTKRNKKDVGKTFRREKKLTNLFFVTMTEYQKELPVSAIAFPPPKITNTLSEVLSKNGKLQFHLAESEKERMVTFYFDGLREESVEGQDVEIVASPKVATYDRKPKMATPKLVKKLRKALKKRKYDFCVLNFANPDMVGHSGNMQATIKAIRIVDKALLEVSKMVLAVNGTLVVTADHGNAEELLTYPGTNFYYTTSKGSLNTEHSNNPVPIIIVSNSLKGNTKKITGGSLADVATTILSIMGISAPTEMTGRDLLAN